MIPEKARHNLYTHASGTWGEEVASVLMDYLPPVGWGDVATKAHVDRDMEILRTELRGFQNETHLRFDQIDRRFEEVDRRFEEIDRRFEDVDRRFDEVDGKFGEMREFIRAEVGRQTRVMIFSMISTVATVFGLAFALARF